ncbi:MAG: DUF6463 family protein [Polaromonas sp.]|nr:DUF6463 family protein [Polaromonas sp.]
MLLIAARVLLILGVLHVIFGLVRFRGPLLQAAAEGFVGRFGHSDTRRLVFWFIVIGPMLALLGQVSLQAIERGDLVQIRTIGCYLLATGVLGVLAFPKSPLWSLLPTALVFIAAGFGWLT